MHPPDAAERRRVVMNARRRRRAARSWYRRRPSRARRQGCRPSCWSGWSSGCARRRRNAVDREHVAIRAGRQRSEGSLPHTVRVLRQLRRRDAASADARDVAGAAQLHGLRGRRENAEGHAAVGGYLRRRNVGPWLDRRGWRLRGQRRDRQPTTTVPRPGVSPRNVSPSYNSSICVGALANCNRFQRAVSL